MLVNVNQKSIGKNKGIRTIPLEYKKVPGNIYELIEETVKIMVESFVSSMKRKASPLSEQQINDLAQIGKISFGIIYNDKKPDVNKAVEVAVLAYRDGLVRIFINGEPVEAISDIDTPTDDELRNTKIELNEGDTITFVRLTMLAGRMW